MPAEMIVFSSVMGVLLVAWGTFLFLVTTRLGVD